MRDVPIILSVVKVYFGFSCLSVAAIIEIGKIVLRKDGRLKVQDSSRRRCPGGCFLCPAWGLVADSEGSGKKKWETCKQIRGVSESSRTELGIGRKGSSEAGRTDRNGTGLDWTEQEQEQTGRLGGAAAVGHHGEEEYKHRRKVRPRGAKRRSWEGTAGCTVQQRTAAGSMVFKGRETRLMLITSRTGSP